MDLGGAVCQLQVTFLKDNTDMGYAFPNGVLDQWSDECDAEGDPLGEAPMDEHDWARFQAGNFYLHGQVTLNRLTDLQDLVSGTIGYGFSTTDGMPLTFEQAVMPEVEKVPEDSIAYYISEPVTFSAPAASGREMISVPTPGPLNRVNRSRSPSGVSAFTS